jgi:hypothetical protein
VSQPVYIQVAPVVDARDPREARALLRDFNIGSEITDDIEWKLTRRYDSQLPPAGFEDNLVILQVRVERYDVAVKTGFLSADVQAVAQIELNLFGADNRSLYKARYRADNRTHQPFAIYPRVQPSLDYALDAAVEEIFTDRRLFQKINRSSPEYVG